MKLKWYGHACFGMEFSGGPNVVTDPFDESVGYELCRAQADVVTTSHGHFDHNYVSSLTGEPTILNRPGLFTFDDLVARGVSSYHDAERGARRGSNIIYIFESDGLRIAHLGDLGHIPDMKQYAYLTDVDVLLIPIGGYYTIDTAAALEIIGEVKPKIAIPMHFKTGVNNFPISDEREFAEKAGAKYWDGTQIEITRENIDKYPCAIVLKYAD